MKRISELFITLCFLGLLAAGLAVTVLRPAETVSYYENRMLAVLPQPSAQSVGDGSFTTQLELYLDDHAALRNTLLFTKGRLDLALHRPVVNGIVVTDGPLLPFLYPEYPNQATIAAQAAAYADRLKGVSDAAAEYGGYFCYVGVPCQYSYFEDEYPWYLYNRSQLSELSTTALAQAAAERGVNYLDIRAAYEEMGHPEGFGSLIDNHYTMEGAFAAYQVILDRVAADTGLNFPILREEDVVFETLPNDYMGSRERRLLNLVQREEQLSILHPKRDVPFDRFDNGEPSSPYIYGIPDSTEQALTYMLYMGGDIANTVIDTHREELPTVLVYGDSFTNAFESVAYLSFDEMHSIDLRYYTEMGLTDYIRELQPDIVIGIIDFEALIYPYGNGAV